MFKNQVIHYLPFKGGRTVVFLCCLFFFWCQSFGDDSPYVGSYYLSSVGVAEWPPFGKELLIRLTICSPGV